MQNFSARYCGTSVTPKPDFNAFSAFSTCVSQSHALRQAKVKWCQYITSPRHCCRPGTMCRAKTWATFYCQQLLLPTGEWTIMQYWNKSIYSCSLNLTHCQPISIYADCACDNVRRCWCGTLWSVSLQSMWNCSEQFQKGKKKKVHGLVGCFRVASCFKLFGATTTCLLWFTCTYIFLCLQVWATNVLVFKPYTQFPTGCAWLKDALMWFLPYTIRIGCAISFFYNAFFLGFSCTVCL